MSYVEVKAKTVDLAVEAAMRELNVVDRQRLDIKVLQEPERGFLGFGGQDAIVRVEERPERPKRRRGGKGNGKGRQEQSGPRDQQAKKGQTVEGQQSRAAKGGNEGGRRRGGDSNPAPSKASDDRDLLTATAQEPMVKEFLAGLVAAFGLEGEVQTRIDQDVIVADVVGDQTSALVGPRGTVMEAVHELTKTVLQRTAQDSARVRIDIAGYAERRRQALTIYAGELIEQVLEDGGEIMLDPMSAADRKVIHDAVATRQGVRSYSEGEAPDRYVVIAAFDDE